MLHHIQHIYWTRMDWMGNLPALAASSALRVAAASAVLLTLIMASSIVDRLVFALPCRPMAAQEPSGHNA